MAWLAPENILSAGVVIQLKLYSQSLPQFPSCSSRVIAQIQGDNGSRKTIEPLVATLNDGMCTFRPQASAGQSNMIDSLTAYSLLVGEAILEKKQLVLFEMKVLDSTGLDVGSAFFAPSSLTDFPTFGNSVCPVLMTDDLGNRPSSILVEYAIIKRYSRSITVPIHLNEAVQWKSAHKDRVLHIGHRGLGNGRKTPAQLLENTIASYNAAATAGADMIELDVCLTKDGQVVVYHDLELVHADTNLIVPIKDVTYAQLCDTNFVPVNKDLLSEERRKLKFFSDEQNPENRPFPKLAEVLQKVMSSCAINVEIKFPHLVQDGSWIPHPPLEINYYVDTILEQIFEHCGDRDILITCFDPDVCMSCRAKQSKFPIMFLTRGSREIFPRLKDMRMSMVDTALYFASSADLVGVNAFARDLVSESKPLLDLAKGLDLLMFVWDSKLNVDEVVKLAECGITGLIYDDIDTKLVALRTAKAAKSPPTPGSLLVVKPLQ